MSAGRALLPGPRLTAVGRRNNEAVSADGPAVRRSVRGKSDRREMVFCRRADLGPFISAVLCNHDRSARSDSNSVLTILNVQPIESRDHAGALALPLKAAVGAVEDHTVGAHRPTVKFVGGETDRADRIPLRPGILPFPSLFGSLSRRRRGKRNHN